MSERQKYKLLSMNNRGFTLVGVLMVLVVLSILGLSITAIASNSMKTSSGERDDQSVFYIAEAGLVERKEILKDEISKAFQEILPDLIENEKMKPEDRIDPEELFITLFNEAIDRLVNTGKFMIDNFEPHLDSSSPYAEVTVTEEDLKYTIRSVGHIGKKNKSRIVLQELAVVFDPESIPKPNKNVKRTLNSCFALYTSGSIDKENGTINGDIYSTKKLVISNSGSPTNGNIYSTEDIVINGGNGIKNVYSLKNVVINNGTIDGSVYAGGSFTMSGGTITGDVKAGDSINTIGWGTIKGSAIVSQDDLDLSIINGKIFNDCTSKIPTLENKNDVFKSPPSTIERPVDKSIPGYNSSEIVNFIKDGTLDMTHQKTNGETLELNSDLYFNTINITGNKLLNIDLKGGTRTIYVDSLKLGQGQGNIKIINPGTLNIQVLGDMNIASSSSITNADKSDKINTNIFYAGRNSVILAGSANLMSNLHVKNADLEFTSGSGVHGNVYVYGENNIKVSGGSKVANQLFLAPNSNFIHDNGTISGNVVAKNYKITGGGTINPPKENSGPIDSVGPLEPEYPEGDEEAKYYILNFKAQIEE